MNSYAYHVRHKNEWGTGFGPEPTHCAQCGASIVKPEGCGTGYGCSDERPIRPADLPEGCDAPTLKAGESFGRSRAICYACCGLNDAREMQETGRAVLYLTYEDDPLRHTSHGALRIYYASNWPGTLKIRIGGAVRHSRNNFGAQRTDVWFRHAGAEWHGVNIGDNQLLRCKRLKGK